MEPFLGFLALDQSGVQDAFMAGRGWCVGEAFEGFVHVVEEVVLVAEGFDLEGGEEVVSAGVFGASPG